jgi:hypothetical protein
MRVYCILKALNKNFNDHHTEIVPTHCMKILKNGLFRDVESPARDSSSQLHLRVYPVAFEVIMSHFSCINNGYEHI